MVEIVILHEAQPSAIETTFRVQLSRAQHVLPYIKVCVGDSKGGDRENRCFARSERKRGREARGAPFQRGFVSPSKSNSVYEKAAEGVIPASVYTLVRVI